ncbi:MAG: thioredoxin domain-containing protein [Polyangiaceae bacterium]
MADDGFSLQWRRAPSGQIEVRLTGLKPPGEVDAVMTPLRRQLFGLSKVVTPESVRRDGEVTVITYPAMAAAPSLAEHPPADGFDVARELADAIGELHDRGYCHGALDPRLCFVTPNGVRILGAGIAELMEAAGARGSATEFVAPELHGGGEPTVAADVFALGKIASTTLGLPSGAAVLSRATHESPTSRHPDAWDLRDALIAARSELLARPAVLGTHAAPAAQSNEGRNDARADADAPQIANAFGSAAGAPQISADASGAAAGAPQISADASGADGSLRPAARPDVPLLQVPPPPTRREGGSWAWLFVVGGLALLLLGFAGVFAYSFSRAKPSPSATPPTVATTAPSVAPPPLVEPPPVPPPTIEPPLDPTPEQLDGGTGLADAESTPDAASVPGPAPSPPAQGPALAAQADGEAPLPVADDVPHVGPATAPVTLVVFGGLACPHTRRSIPVLDKLRTAFPADLRVYFRHRPLPQHPHAMSAARVAEGLRAAEGDESFFRLLRELSGSASGSADASELGDALRKLGLRRRPEWLTDARVAARVDEDLQYAGLFAVRETPTFFVNGERIEGFHDFRALQSVVQKERSAARALAARGMSAKDVYRARTRMNMIGIGVEVPERTCPTVGEQPARGATNPLVTIVEFSDFECPFCKRLNPALDQVLAKRGGDVRLVWRNYPLANHSQARPAATLALAAFAQKGARGFWRAHDDLFGRQGALSDATFRSIATALGLDADAALRAVQTDAYASALNDDAKEGARVGVKGTPTLFINGRMLAGARGPAELLNVVDEEIEWARRLVQSGTPRHRIYQAVCGE